jgi:hypothetical protein
MNQQRDLKLEKWVAIDYGWSLFLDCSKLQNMIIFNLRQHSYSSNSFEENLLIDLFKICYICSKNSGNISKSQLCAVLFWTNTRRHSLWEAQKVKQKIHRIAECQSSAYCVGVCAEKKMLRFLLRVAKDSTLKDWFCILFFLS